MKVVADESQVARLHSDESARSVCSASFRAEGVMSISSEVIRNSQALGAEEEQQQPNTSANIQALVVTSFLFTLITVVQVFAAEMANSKALLMDCVSMGVDAMTYMGNIFVECRKRDGRDHKGSQLIVCAISLSLLIYFTYTAGMESLLTAKACVAHEIAEDGDDVNGWITLGFGVGGVVFDLISLWSFRRSERKGNGDRAVNMLTALLHVGADFLRSSSTVVMSLLILLGGYDSTCLDAYTSLLIGALIIGGACVGIFHWVKLAHEFFAPQEEVALKTEQVV